MDLKEHRAAAKELFAGMEQGEADAIARVIAAHPIYVGRPPERFEVESASLRDAQATVAGEHGFESWGDLVAACDRDSRVRWRTGARAPAEGRCGMIAHELGHSHFGGPHLLMAILRTDPPSVARSVLEELGASSELAADRFRNLWRPPKDEFVRGTAVYYATTAWARAFAAATGARRVTDEHLLLGLVYDRSGGSSDLIPFNIDPMDVVDGLAARGVRVPEALPPTLQTPVGPLGPYLYYPAQERLKVLEALESRCPPGSFWGRGESLWKSGLWYAWGADILDVEAVVRDATADPETIVVVPWVEAHSREENARQEAEL